MNRRKFMTDGTKTAALASLALSGLSQQKLFGRGMTPAQPRSKPTLEYRMLGKTGLSVTAISYGAMRTRDEAVIHRALDMGINYIDTARGYMGGHNEEVVGNVLKTRRKEAFVATKFRPGSVDDILDSIHASLKALKTDYIDVIQIHNISGIEEIKDPVTMEALQRIKKEGKARFVGFTTHRNQVALILEAIKIRFYDVILTGYSFQSPSELTHAIEAAAKAGIGIVAMKTQAGGYADSKMGNLSPHQAALKWVLQNPGVTNAIPSMVTYNQLEENIQVMGSRMGWNDRKILHRYAQTIDAIHCRMCNGCADRCPSGVDPLEVNRCLMYAKGYGDWNLASATYQAIPNENKPILCSSCKNCAVECRHGLRIRDRMIQAVVLLS